MPHTFSFYSISPAQVKTLSAGYKDQLKTTDDGSAIIEGDSPLGPVKLQLNYAPSSRVLTVTVLSKPPLVLDSTVETHLRDKLSHIPDEPEPNAPKETQQVAQPTAPPTPQTEKAVPAATPEKKEEVQKPAAALKA